MLRQTRARSWAIAALALAALLGAGLLIRAWLHHTVDGQLQQFVRLLPGGRAVHYQSLQVRPWPLRVRVKEARVLFDPGAAAIAVQRVQLNRFEPGRHLPRRVEASLEGIEIPCDHPLLTAAAPWLRELGYAALGGDIDLRAVQTEGSNDRWRLALALRARAAGTLRADLALRGVDAEGVARAWNDPVVWLRVLPPVGIESAAVEFEDGGWGERFVMWHARQAGEDLETARRRIEVNLTRQAASAPPGALRTLMGQMAQFVAAPGRIGLYTANTQPVTLGRLALARSLADRMALLQSASYVGAAPHRMPWESAAPPTSGAPPPS